MLRLISLLLIMTIGSSLAQAQNEGDDLFDLMTEDNIDEFTKLIKKKKVNASYEKELSKDFHIPVLVQAVQDNKTDFAIVLIDAGADVNAADGFEMTPLLWAASNGNAKLVKILLDEGADKDAKTAEGMDALLSAKQEGHEDIVKLLGGGPDIKMK